MSSFYYPYILAFLFLFGSIQHSFSQEIDLDKIAENPKEQLIRLKKEKAYYQKILEEYAAKKVFLIEIDLGDITTYNRKKFQEDLMEAVANEEMTLVQALANIESISKDSERFKIKLEAHVKNLEKKMAKNQREVEKLAPSLVLTEDCNYYANWTPQQMKNLKSVKESEMNDINQNILKIDNEILGLKRDINKFNKKEEKSTNPYTAQKQKIQEEISRIESNIESLPAKKAEQMALENSLGNLTRSKGKLDGLISRLTLAQEELQEQEEIFGKLRDNSKKKQLRKEIKEKKSTINEQLIKISNNHNWVIPTNFTQQDWTNQLKEKTKDLNQFIEAKHDQFMQLEEDIRNTQADRNVLFNLKIELASINAKMNNNAAEKENPLVKKAENNIIKKEKTKEQYLKELGDLMSNYEAFLVCYNQHQAPVNTTKEPENTESTSTFVWVMKGGGPVINPSNAILEGGKANGSFWKLDISPASFTRTTKWDNYQDYQFEFAFIGDIPAELYPGDVFSLSISGKFSWRKLEGLIGEILGAETKGINVELRPDKKWQIMLNRNSTTDEVTYNFTIPETPKDEISLIIWRGSQPPLLKYTWVKEKIKKY